MVVRGMVAGADMGADFGMVQEPRAEGVRSLNDVGLLTPSHRPRAAL
jgi:hypothetical protein